MANIQLNSPWLEHLNKRPTVRLHANDRTDIAIVGAGIAGISTAYFLLKHTKKHILVLEADRIAHGATGHNAGQLVSYFERPFTDIANEFGPEMAAEGQRAVESAWKLLDDMRNDLHIQTPYQTFQGYAGCMDLDEILVHLRNNAKRAQAGLVPETTRIADSFSDITRIPRSLKALYTVVRHEEILNLLQTKNHRYIAALSGKKGVMNSAHFCEEVFMKLRERYSNRFRVMEHTPIHVVKLYAHDAELRSGPFAVRAKRVVLCTNGFEKFTIENHSGGNIDVKFHHLVKGSVGYMAAFLEKPQMEPTAISYLPSHPKQGSGTYTSDPYYYLTRRPHGDTTDTSLICIGGPDAPMDDTNDYSKEHPYPNEAKTMIDRFVRKTYQHTGRRLQFTHLWHGLMGYTPNGIRCIGAEPCNPILLYNLGCNGVGLLPSLYGGYRISQIVKEGKLKPSIFDPADLRCMLPGEQSEEDIVTSSRWFEQHVVWSLIVFWTCATIALLAYYWIEIETHIKT